MTKMLKSCPFCGSDDVWPCTSSEVNNPEEILSAYVNCNKCNAQGPEAEAYNENGEEDLMKEQATKLWNERS